MFSSFQQLISNYLDIVSRRSSVSSVNKQKNFHACLDGFFPKKENIIIESFSRGILTIKAPHASVLFDIELKKEKILFCFQKNNIPVKKIVCKI